MMKWFARTEWRRKVKQGWKNELDNEPCMENVASAMTEVVVEDVDGGKRV